MTLLGQQEQRDGLCRDIGVPKGIICMWSGAANAVPAGWALCDGTNGTPNLADKVIVAAGATYAAGASGGSATHDHALPFAIGSAALRFRYGSEFGTRGTFTGTQTISHTDSTYAGAANVLSDDASSLPPYYALCYVMKM